MRRTGVAAPTPVIGAGPAHPVSARCEAAKATRAVPAVRLVAGLDAHVLRAVARALVRDAVGVHGARRAEPAVASDIDAATVDAALTRRAVVTAARVTDRD